MSLRAPLAVPVEVRSHEGAGEVRRAFRLSANVGEDGVRLVRPAPFDVGRPVAISFTLPDADAIVLQAEVALADGDGEGEQGGRELSFVGAPAEVRETLHRYVVERLGLPPL
jgi:hypothetical protein